MGALLGIDLGTSSVKVVVTDPAGRVLAQAAEPYAVLSPREGWAETPPQIWEQAVARAVARVPLAGVTGAGLSGQMHGVVLCRAGGDPVRPAVLHADARATAELGAYRALPAAALARLANPLAPGMAGPVLAWLARHEPEAYAQARWALQPKDWLRLRLTGRAAAEPSDASATLLYDVPGERWDGEVVEALGLREDLLAPLLPSAGTPAGGVRRGGALGLPEGLPVAAGGGDTAVAAVGTGLLDPGTVQLTVGTGGQALTPLAAPLPAPGVHLYRTATPRGWYALGATLGAGLALSWVVALLGASWPELYAAAARAPRDDDPFFLPHLAGERTPFQDPALRGAWTGLSLRHGREDLLRAALEGVALGLRAALEALPAAPTGPVRLAGGGTVDPGFRHLLADVLQRPLVPVLHSGASARGAALLGGVATGQLDGQDLRVTPPLGDPVEPDGRVAAAVADRAARWRALVERR